MFHAHTYLRHPQLYIYIIFNMYIYIYIYKLLIIVYSCMYIYKYTAYNYTHTEIDRYIYIYIRIRLHSSGCLHTYWLWRLYSSTPELPRNLATAIQFPTGLFQPIVGIRFPQKRDMGDISYNYIYIWFSQLSPGSTSLANLWFSLNPHMGDFSSLEKMPLVFGMLGRTLLNRKTWRPYHFIL
jgi:hypothetical protein